MASYLGTRKLKDGRTVHRAIVRRRGFPVRVFQAATKTATRPTDGSEPEPGCMDLAADYEAEIRAGEIEDGKATVADALAVYRASDDFEALADRDRRGNMLDWWEERIGELPLNKLGAVHDAIADARDALKAGEGPSAVPLTPSTRNRYMAALSKALKVARRERSAFRRLLRYNPARELGRASEAGNMRTRILEDDEFKALLAACRATGDRRLPSLFLCALSSGARKGELLSLRRTEVDPAAGVAPVWQTKNRRPRNLHFYGEALAALRAYLGDTPPHVSGALWAADYGAPTFPRAAWESALKEAEVEGVVWHTLRHTSMTWAAIQGATELELMVHGGHRTSAMVARYTHLAEHRRSEVAPRLLPDWRGGRQWQVERGERKVSPGIPARQRGTAGARR